MHYSVNDIAKNINGQLINGSGEEIVQHIVYDTRKINFNEQSIFFALKTPKADGHDYISDAYSKGVRSFVISDKSIHQSAHKLYPNASLILVADTLVALQELARHYRLTLPYPILAITGSNGKTIIKEWLYQALTRKLDVGKSPLSYNSQLGVAVSILDLDADKDIAIIEAGISQKGEMDRLTYMIQPTVGLFTNIGDAHSEGFSDRSEKIKEKLKLFEDCEIVLYNKDQKEIDQIISQVLKHEIISWGQHPDSDIKIQISSNQYFQEIDIQYGNREYHLQYKFSVQHLAENILHVVSYLILDGWSESDIQSAIHSFSTLPNRLELKRGTNDCLILNDSYSSDLASLQIAFEQLGVHGKGKTKVAFISELDHQKNQKDSYKKIESIVKNQNVSQLITIGIDSTELNVPDLQITSYDSTEACLSSFDFDSLHKTAILIKGASKFRMETIANVLSEQIHQTNLETNLSAVGHNLKVYRSLLKPETKIMAVVKAQAYGSGSSQLVTYLESQGIDYLAVALIDEAVELRQNNCRLPIMIFNVEIDNLSQLWKYNLEPEVYNFELLNKLIEASHFQSEPIKIHLKIDTGMHRLGFMPDDLTQLLEKLREVPMLEVTSIFSHLSASESSEHDDYTRKQIQQFDEAYDQLKSAGDAPLKHILNTAGIVRFPDQQYDMVRLGLGLYGIDESDMLDKQLIKAHTLKAKILQIKDLKPNETTGYSRMGLATEATRIAVVSLGYADGLMRQAGNGQYALNIKGVNYPTIGNICMDVCMIKLKNDSEIKVGDEVTVFGPDLPIENLANSCNTISYEIISRIAPRVKRTYIYE